jgi:hypothetical protein
MAKKSEAFEFVSQKAQEIYLVLSQIGIRNPLIKKNRIVICDDSENDYIGVNYAANQNTFGKIGFEPLRMVLPQHKFASLGFEYALNMERDDSAYTDLIHGDGSITHYGSKSKHLPIVGFTWEKDPEKNLAKITKFSIRFPVNKSDEKEYEYFKELSWKRIQAPSSPNIEKNIERIASELSNLPDSLVGQTEINGIILPWEIDYDQKIQEIIDTSKLDDFQKRLTNLL